MYVQNVGLGCSMETNVIFTIKTDFISRYPSKTSLTNILKIITFNLDDVWFYQNRISKTNIYILRLQAQFN